MKKLILVGSNSIHTFSYYELIKDDFDDIILITEKGSPPIAKKQEYLDFFLRHPVRALKTIFTIRKIIETFSPSVIHILQANSYSLLTLLATKGKPFPTVVTALGSEILFMPYKGYFYKKMVKYILHHASSFTSDSVYMADKMKLLANDPSLDILIANFGINLTENFSSKENLIYSNRLHKKIYRIDKIIEAFDVFIKKRNLTDWKLVISGVGEETPDLRKKVEELGVSPYVEFKGWVDKEKNSEYYSKAKLFISIPVTDATSISLLEAMASGCIPVVSDLPANREWITNNVNGLIVNDVDTDFIGIASEMNLEDIRKINEGIIKKNGTKESNREKFISLYNRLLKT